MEAVSEHAGSHAGRNGAPPSWAPPLVAAIAVAVGTTLRIRGLDSTLPWGDEFHSLRLWTESFATILATYDDRGTGVPLLLLQRLFHDLLGPTLRAARLPALLGGLTALALVYPVAKRFVGSTAAALATAAIALSPIHVFYAHFGRAYSLATALALVFVFSLQRATESRSARIWLGLAAATGALLAWVHATAAIIVIAAGAAAFARTAVVFGWGRRLFSVAAALCVAGIACALLYAPAWSTASEFFTHTAGSTARERISITVVASLIAGSTVAGWLVLLSVPTAAVAHLVSRRSSGLLLVVAALASAAVLWIVSPRGGPYAYTRYVLVSFPFAVMLICWAWVELGKLLARRAAGVGATVAFVAGLFAVTAGYATGPLAPTRVEDGPFGGTYLSLWPLERFDAPWKRAPVFYRDLAAREDVQRILEVPLPRSRGMLLYRNYYLMHGKETWVAEVGTAAIVGESLIGLERAIDACESGADLVILHRALDRELTRYWRQVYRKFWQVGHSATTIALSRTLKSTPFWFRRKALPLLAKDFALTFGRPVYKDDVIDVFEIDPRVCDRKKRHSIRGRDS